MLLRNVASLGSEQQLLEGPEDIIVRGKVQRICSVHVVISSAHYQPEEYEVRRIIRNLEINRLMRFATLNHIKVTKYPNLRFEDQETSDMSGPWLLSHTWYFIFDISGKEIYASIDVCDAQVRLTARSNIRNCGILEMDK